MKRKRAAGDGDGEAEEEAGDALAVAKRGAPAAAAAAAVEVPAAAIAPSHSYSSSYSHNNRVSHNRGCGAGNNPASASASASGSASAMNWMERRKLRRRLHEDLQMVKGLIARLEARQRVLSCKDLEQGRGSGSGADSSAQPSSSGQEAGGGALTRDGGTGSVAKQCGDAFTKERSAVGARMALAANTSDSRGREKKTEIAQSVANHDLSEVKQPKHSDPRMEAAEAEAFFHKGKNPREIRHVVEGGVITESNMRTECLNILEDLLKNRNAWAFEKPVLSIWPHLFDYSNRIKSPMDLGTVKMKLLNAEYSDPREFAADVRLTFSNAFAYNEKGSVFYNSAKHMNLRFNSKFRSLETRLARKLDQKAAAPRDRNSPRSQDPASEAKTAARTASGLLAENGVITQANKRLHSEEKLRADRSNEGIPPQKIDKKPKSKQRMDKPPSSRLGRSNSASAYGGVRPLTAKEREKLPLLIESLPADRVKKVIEILKQKNPGLESASGEVELDLGKFDEETMFELYRLAMNWQKSKKKVLGRFQPSIDSKEPAQNSGGSPISGKDLSNLPAQPTHTKDRDSGGVKAPHLNKEKVIDSRTQEASRSASEFSSSSGSSTSSSGSGSGSDSESDADSQRSSPKP